MPPSTTKKTAGPSWGNIVDLDAGDKHKVKRIVIKKGKSTPTHAHTQRTEQWVVVSGHGMLTIDGQERFIGTGGHVSIPKGKKHSIEASVDLELIEIQLGACDDKDTVLVED